MKSARKPVDVALLDVIDAGSHGFSVCRAIKARPETCLVPVVLVTGLGSAGRPHPRHRSGRGRFPEQAGKERRLWRACARWCASSASRTKLENAETVLCSLARSHRSEGPYTEGHCDRLSRYTVSLGEKNRIAPKKQRIALRRGGIVHDVGKVAVPDYVLLKPGPLDAAERKIMEEHPIVRRRICAPLKSFRNVLPIILPTTKNGRHGLSRSPESREIPLTARILQPWTSTIPSPPTGRTARRSRKEKALEIMWKETRQGWWTLIS